MAPRALVGLALLVAASRAEARVDPTSLGVAARPKPNILILLDTSGSMSGVAGTPFAPASEVGMDCEHGENCRLGGLASECQESKRACRSSEECRSGRCSADNRTPCVQDSDCPQGLGRCSQTGGSCARDVDCPQPRCKADKPAGTCSREERTTCESDDDCPTTLRCQRSGDLCRKDSDCPVFGAAICDAGARANRTCRDNTDCPASRCVTTPANPCTGTPNACQLAGAPCLANTCLPPASNLCQQPRSPHDACVPAASGAPGPLRMCQVLQKVCTQDADCGESRDCGPASSRAMIVKRALSKWVVNNRNLANFGLMTFFQDGYFPYVPTDASVSETVAVFLGEGQLRRLGCYSWDARAGTGGPSATCMLDGRQAILRASADSRYRTTTDRQQSEIETDFCGESCELPNHRGLGLYLGSTYWLQETSPAKASSEIMVRDHYEGHDITVGGRSYAYFGPRNDLANGGEPPPFQGATCRDACSVRCGAGWNAQLVPFLDVTDNPDKAWAAAQAISARMDDAAHGGWVRLGGTPTGCALDNQASPTPLASAFHYMSAVKKGARHPDLTIAPDLVACRRSFVLLLTDGLPNGPGDVDDAGNSLCAEPACAAADPVSAGCRCRSVLAAARLHRELGVTLLVVGFSVDASNPTAAAANHNIAKAGGSERAALLARPHELEATLEAVLARAAAPGESSPFATPSSDEKQILSTRTEYPGWRGHMSAYAAADRKPTLLWDAQAKLSAPGAWKQRRVYTWTGSRMVKIQVDPGTGAIGNKDELAAAGMGAHADEAERVARWLLGDPATGNPAPLGAIVHSRPVEVAAPADSDLPGGHAHFLRHVRRPALAYVGASDQMLHAFVLAETSVAGVSQSAGSEAFAFIPPDLLPHVRQLVLQGGQRPSPAQHIFGVDGSAQAIDLCISGCADEKSALWKTLLVVSEGPGGQHAFALDITDPLASKDPPFAVPWHTGLGAAGRAQPPVWKDNQAAPALLFNPTPELDDYQLVSASGFGVGPLQRPSVTSLLARHGGVAWSKPLSPNIACVQEYAVVTDVVTARAGQHHEQTVAGYFGDTAGQLWRITPAGGLGVLADFTCAHPLHFSPTVVQHAGAADRDIYLVQVTNSQRDPTTLSWPASQLVFLKQVIDRNRQGHVTGSHTDDQWGQAGRISLTVGSPDLCAQTYRNPDGQGTCDRALPGNVRPLGKPLAIPSPRGFRVATLWGEPEFSACQPGRSFLTLHQMESDKITQLWGAPLKVSAPAPSPVVRDGRLWVFGGQGEFEEIALE